MKSSILYLLTVVLCLSSECQLHAQTFISVTGYVRDHDSREPLPYASVKIEDGQGAYANRLGFFAVDLPTGNHQITVSYAGYKVIQVEGIFAADTSLECFLVQGPSIDTVEIEAMGGAANSVLHRLHITQEFLTSLPALGSEADPLRALMVLPGISTGTEESADLVVRGGGRDQNLFLIDGAPLYMAGHALNFLSLFQGGLVQGIDLYTGYQPPQYGGRLSSVIDMTFREGNRTRLQGKMQLGLITSQGILEGPIGKQKRTSFLIGVRSTYLELFGIGRQAEVEDRSTLEDDSYLVYGFSDAHAKITHYTTKNIRLYLHAYGGRDRLKMLRSTPGDFESNRNFIGNVAISAGAAGQLGTKGWWEAGTFYVTQQQRDDALAQSFSWESIPPPPQFFARAPTIVYTLLSENSSMFRTRIKDFGAKVLFQGSLNHNWAIKGGGELIVRHYEPGDLQLESRVFPGDTVSRNVITGVAPNAQEQVLFLENNLVLSPSFQLDVGLRGEHWLAGKQNFLRLSPRVRLGWEKNHWTGQLSYTRAYQYQHALLRPTERQDLIVWIPATEGLLPQQSDQISVALGYQAGATPWSIHVEAYMKEMAHLTMLFSDPLAIDWFATWSEGLLREGEGRAFGVELWAFWKKERLSITGAYTLAWSERRFDDLNQGNWFPDWYDRRHQLTLTGIWRLSDTWTSYAIWNLASGRRTNLPQGIVPENPYSFGYTASGTLNQDRLPLYHRLDLGLAWNKPLENGNSWGMRVDLYNAYNRLNVSSVYVVNSLNDQGKEVLTLKGRALLPIIPSLTFSYQF